MEEILHQLRLVTVGISLIPLIPLGFLGSINGAWTRAGLGTTGLAALATPWPHGGACDRVLWVATVTLGEASGIGSKVDIDDIAMMPSMFHWRFPKMMGFPPKSPILIGDFSIINHPFWGTTNLRKHPNHLHEKPSKDQPLRPPNSVKKIHTCKGLQGKHTHTAVASMGLVYLHLAKPWKLPWNPQTHW